MVAAILSATHGVAGPTCVPLPLPPPASASPPLPLPALPRPYGQSRMRALRGAAVALRNLYALSTADLPTRRIGMVHAASTAHTPVPPGKDAASRASHSASGGTGDSSVTTSAARAAKPASAAQPSARRRVLGFVGASEPSVSAGPARDTVSTGWQQPPNIFTSLFGRVSGTSLASSAACEPSQPLRWQPRCGHPPSVHRRQAAREDPGDAPAAAHGVALQEHKHVRDPSRPQLQVSKLPYWHSANDGRSMLCTSLTPVHTPKHVPVLLCG